MRVLLLNTETKLYYAGTNQWTERVSDAMDFEHIDRAAHMYAVENLSYAEIVIEPGMPVGPSLSPMRVARRAAV
jgi:hypothetical protein